MKTYVVLVKMGSFGWFDKQSFGSLEEAKAYAEALAGTRFCICERVRKDGYFVDTIVD